MYIARLIGQFIRVSFLEETAYRANFYLALLNSLLGLAGGLLGIAVVYGQRAEVGGWDRAGALAVLGVYLLAQALHSLFIGPGLDSLSGLSGDLWTGRLDFTLLRPLNTQFMVSVRRWRPWALVDLALALSVLGYAVALAGARPGAGEWLAFAAALGCGLIILYALLLACTAVIFWSPGLLLTWVFQGIIQMARYPLGLYPGWLRLALTWVVPVGLITTLPAEALAGRAEPAMLAGSAALALALLAAASALFRAGLRRYESASS